MSIDVIFAASSCSNHGYVPDNKIFVGYVIEWNVKLNKTFFQWSSLAINIDQQ